MMPPSCLFPFRWKFGQSAGVFKAVSERNGSGGDVFCVNLRLSDAVALQPARPHTELLLKNISANSPTRRGLISSVLALILAFRQHGEDPDPALFGKPQGPACGTL
ncbi:uncharacterized protein V6R79_013834 [Siganus canaliculatus]